MIAIICAYCTVLSHDLAKYCSASLTPITSLSNSQELNISILILYLLSPHLSSKNEVGGYHSNQSMYNKLPHGGMVQGISKGQKKPLIGARAPLCPKMDSYMKEWHQSQHFVVAALQEFGFWTLPLILS